MHIQKDISWAEEDVKVEREFVYKDMVGRIMGNWVPETGTSISRDTKYLKSVTSPCIGT